jgi:hypothetical protein
MNSPLKVKPYPGLQRIAPETIEKHEMEQQLRDAQLARARVLDVQLHERQSYHARRAA